MMPSFLEQAGDSVEQPQAPPPQATPAPQAAPAPQATALAPQAPDPLDSVAQQLQDAFQQHIKKADEAEAYRKQVIQQFQQLLDPNVLQSRLPKPSARQMLSDALYDINQLNAKTGQAPIGQQRLALAMKQLEEQRGNLKGLMDAVSGQVRDEHQNLLENRQMQQWIGQQKEARLNHMLDYSQNPAVDLLDPKQDYDKSKYKSVQPYNGMLLGIKTPEQLQKEREASYMTLPDPVTNFFHLQPGMKVPIPQGISMLEQINKLGQPITTEDAGAMLTASFPGDTKEARETRQRFLVPIQNYIGKGNQPMAQKLLDQAIQEAGSIHKGTSQAKLDFSIHMANAKNAAEAANQPLTDDAIDMAAQLYRSTGQMPSLGSRNAAAARLIMNRAAAIGPIDLASEKAFYNANKTSLASTQKNLDAVSAFEGAANKNLDLLIDEGQKIIDTGSPWINAPLRTIDKKLLGSKDQMAYDAARQVAVNEIAKVTNSASLSAQLSDTARKEVSGFNPESATLAQTLEVAKILRQDMANRHQSLTETVADIRGRIANAGKSPQSQPANSEDELVKKLVQKYKGNQ